MNDLTGTIYKITNTKTNKSYVGQTIQPLEKRIRAHFSPSSQCKRLHNSIMKWGKEAFKAEPLKVITASSEEELWKELDYWENYYIDKYDTLNNGYNLTSGGQKRFHFSEEECQRRSEAHKGKPSGMKGKHLSDDTKKKLSDLNKGENNAFYGRHHSEATKQLLREQRLGKPNEKWKGGHHSEASKKKMSEAKKGMPAWNRKPVDQYTLDGEYIRTFPSAAQAATELKGKVNSHINDVCNGKRSSWYGYLWKWNV